MKKITLKFLLTVLVVLSSFLLRAQTFTVATQADLVTAINALNTSGVASGGATINFASNVSLTSELPALGSATLNGSTSVANPILFNGAGFTITANYAGTRVGSITTGTNDAVFTLKGVDYLTVQNLIFAEQATNATQTTMIENAVAGYNRNATTPFDGCQYITVSGCTFNMIKNTAGGLSSSIYFTNTIHTGTAALSWASFATLPSDMNREITVTNNTFNGGFNYVVYRGATSANGRNLFVNNNTLNNIGGGTANTSYGVFTTYLDGLEFKNNTASLSVAHTSTSYVCFASTNCGGSQICNSNSITLRSGTTTLTTYGIYLTSIGSLSEIKSNTLNFGSFPAITSGAIYGLYAVNSGGVTNQVTEISSNTIAGTSVTPMVMPPTTGTNYLCYGGASGTVGTLSTAKMLNNNISYLSRTNSGAMYCIYNATAVNTLVENNTVSNINWNNNSASGSVTFYGVYGSNSTVTTQYYRNNTVSNIDVFGTSTSISGTVRGVYSFPSSPLVDISGNTVSNLRFTAGVHTGAVYGIYSGGGSTVTYSKNKVSGLSAVNAGGVVYGTYIGSGATVNFFNNHVTNLATPNATAALALIGLYIGGGTNINVTHNTIYPSNTGALTSTGTGFGATGIYYPTTATVISNVKNNIINLQGTATGTGMIACVRRSGVGTLNVKPANFNPSNNIYFTNAGVANYIYVEGTTTTSTTSFMNGYGVSGLAANVTNNIQNDPNFNTPCGIYKSFMLDAGTFTEDNLVPVGALYAPSGASYAESSATTSTTPAITTDINAVVRGASPDMGSLEFSGTSTDATSPAISYANLPNTICQDNVILTATISDLSGVNNIAGTKPRLYYKLSTEANALVGNTNTNNGWKYVEAFSSVGNIYSFNVNNGLLTAPVGPGSIIQYFVVAQDISGAVNVGNNTAIYASGFCPVSVALDPSGFPVTGLIKQYTISPNPVTVNTFATITSICVSGNTVLSMTGDAVAGAYYQWQSSPTGANTWTDIAGANNITYNVVALTSSTDYRCEISCGDLVANGGNAIGINNSAPVTITVTTPIVSSVTPASRCGTGTVTLGATAVVPSTLNWYTNPTGGVPLATNASLYTTPSISSTTTYYVAAANGGSTGQVPQGVTWNQYTTVGSFQTTTITGAIMAFDAVQGLTIQTLDIYPSSPIGTPFKIEVRQTSGSTGALIASYTGVTTVTNSGTPSVAQTVPVALSIPAGTGYVIGFSATAGLGNPTCWRGNVTNFPYPYSIPGYINIPGASASGLYTSLTSIYQYYFYNWNISTGCESARVPVVATVLTPDPLTISSVPAQNCNNAIVPLSVSSALANYDNYSWAPLTNLYTDAAATIPYTLGGNASTVYVKSNVAGSTTYTCSGFNSATNCANTATVAVNYLPSSVTVSGPTDICISGTTTLAFAPITSATSANIQWNDAVGPVSGANSVSFTTPVISTSTYFNITLKNALGASCFTSPNYAITVQNPQILTTTPATRCGTGTLTLCATAPIGETINWFVAPTGGSPLQLPYHNVAVTGFNSDIVANGVGSNSSLGLSQSFGADGQGYNFIDNTYKYTAANALPTCYMPTSNLMTSLLTPSLTYQLQGYGTATTLVNNSLSLANTSTGSYTSPYPSTGTLTLSTPASLAKLKVLYESVITTGVHTVNAVVTFTDATTQTYTPFTLANWFTAAAPAFTGVGRATSTGVIQCAAQPNFFEMTLPISVANQSKLVQSVTFNIPTTLAATTTAQVNYFHALAVGGQDVQTPAGCYTTPSISATTTYYVSSTSGGGGVTSVGLSNANTTSTAGFGTTSFGILFDVIQPFTLQSVKIYPTSTAVGTSGTVDINVYNNAGSIVHTATVAITGNPAASLIGQTVLLNFPLTVGTGYKLAPVNYTGGSITSLLFEPSLSGAPSYGYPFDVPGYLSITASTLTAAPTNTPRLDLYYYFYDWKILAGCESARVPVVATVIPPAPLTISGSTIKECGNTIVPLSVSSNVADYDTYIWSPTTNLFTDAAATIPYAGTSATTVYLKSAVAGVNTVNLAASNSTNNCANTASTSVEYLPVNLAVSGYNQICYTGAVTLNYTPTTSVTSSNIQWNNATGPMSGVNGTTYTTPTLTASTYYSIDLKNGVGTACYTTPNYTVNVNNPILTSTTPATRCGTGTLQLQATAASPTTQLIWYASNVANAVPIGSGSPFTTPTVSATTTFYVKAADQGAIASGGRLTVQTAGSAIGAAPRGISFVATNAAQIQSFGIMSTGVSSTFDVQLYSGTNTATPLGAAQTFIMPANAGTATVPVLVEFPCNFTLPAAGDYRLFVTAYTGTSPFYYEFSGITGYPYAVGSDVSINGSVTSFTGVSAVTNYYYFYKLTATSLCSSALQSVVATVTPAPSITVSPSANLCNTYLTNLTVSSSNDPNYTYTWNPGSLTGSSVSVSPSVATVYTVTANDNTAGAFAGCQSFGNTTITVLPTPSVPTITSTNPTACPGIVTFLEASGGTVGGIYTLGNASTTTSTMGNTPYSSFYEGARIQYLLTAAELNGLGILAGPIQSIAFNVTTVPVITGTIYPQLGYTIKMTHTSTTSLSTTVLEIPTIPFQTVYGPASQAQPTLGWNTFNFGVNQFNWNGTQNLLIEICHENDNTNACAGCYMTSSTVSAHTTTFNSAFGKYNDNAGACGSTIPSIATTLFTTRPDMRFTAQSPTNKTWSALPGLYSNLLATIPYTGAVSNSVYANPTATTVYTVTATASNGCTRTATTSVFRDPCNNVVSITALIEGYVDGNLAPVVEMRPVLLNQLGFGQDTTDCDSIRVELYASPYTIGDPVISSTIAVLKVSGVGTATFSPPVVAGNYYIRLVHRTAVPTWSTNPVAIGATGSYNFTTASTQAAGSNMVDVNGSGFFALYSGDCDPNGAVDNSDFSVWETDANNFSTGYLATDLDGGGSVGNEDFSIWETNANNFVSEVTP
jgi:hypothetical protein